MFDTLDQAEELNSDCTFCGKPKFKAVTTHGPDRSWVDLVRCNREDCEKHCKWDHEKDAPVLVYEGHEDHARMTSVYQRR